MKSVIYSVALIGCLSVGSAFAQGRGGGGRAGGTVDIPTPASHPSSSSGDHGKPTDPGAKANSQPNAKKGEGTKDPSQQLADNPALLTRLKAIYPNKTDQELEDMAKQFKSLGQFIAAVHVSDNLNIPFDDLKMKMTTGGMSLGDAIHASKPDLNTTAVNAEVKKAEDQAKKDTTGKS